jgi:hypothetical protein
MSEPDATSRPADGLFARSEQERAALFAELMRDELRQNAPPVSGLAAATFVVSLLVWVGGWFSWFIALLWAGCALICGIGALSQILHRERSGLVLVTVGLADLAVWAVYVTVAFPGYGG